MSVTIDIPKNIDAVLHQRSREEHIDTISVLKHWKNTMLKQVLVMIDSPGELRPPKKRRSLKKGGLEMKRLES
jgi:hypothetical protein